MNIEKMSSFLENQHEISRKIKIGFSVENFYMGGVLNCVQFRPAAKIKFQKLFWGFTENQTQNTRKIKFENPLRF